MRSPQVFTENLGELGCSRDGYRLLGVAGFGRLLSLAMFWTLAPHGGGTRLGASVGWLAMGLWVLGVAALAHPASGPLPKWVKGVIIALELSPSVLHVLWTQLDPLSRPFEWVDAAQRQVWVYEGVGWAILALGSAWFCLRHRNRLLAFLWAAVSAVPVGKLLLWYLGDIHDFGTLGSRAYRVLGDLTPPVHLVLLILPLWTAAWLTRRIRQNQPRTPSA